MSQPASREQQGVAIIGMACLFPKARDLDEYWRNILGKVDAVSDPPPESWDPALHYDPGSTDSDKVYCKRGGYLGDLARFDPLAHGIPPMTVGGEPDQWLALKIARDALEDGGYAEMDEAVRHRTAVVLGHAAAGTVIPTQHDIMVPQFLELIKALHPEFSAADLEALRQGLRSQLPSMGPEFAPGLTSNVIVGRIANWLDLMGSSYTVDAACASSLVAVQQALRELESGACDLALAGGLQVWSPLPTLNLFCQLGALSHREEIRPFDKDADGTILGEGLGMMVLKRLADAERDGDRIYAVIRGVGIASDGKANFVMTPRVEGEALAVQRAYEAAGVSPDSVELVEAHGTGTQVGDLAEIQALTSVFGLRQGALPRVAIGSVKSMISHTVAAAGVASMIKTALALYHKVLPPTLNCSEVNPRLELEKTPFYINTEVRPWVHDAETPRRAAVSAFGFGGIDAHVVLEEYRPPAAPQASHRLDTHRPAWDSELCVIEAPTQALLLQKALGLQQAVQKLASRAADDPSVRLEDVAYSLAAALDKDGAAANLRLAIVATSLADLQAKLERACERLVHPDCRQIRALSGIYFAAEPLARQGKLAFLFPGEGSQYVNMLADLCLHFPPVRERFDATDRLHRRQGLPQVPSDYVFPRPNSSPAEAESAARALWEMDGAVASVLTADEALGSILAGLGVQPDAVVGHSSGEFAALQAAGVFGRSDESRADVGQRLMQVNSDDIPAAHLLAIGADCAQVEELIAASGVDARVAMDNCPHQVVVALEPSAAAVLRQAAGARGLIVEKLSFERPYHTPLFGPYSQRVQTALETLQIDSARVPVYSCATAAPFGEDLEAVKQLMAEQWLRPVEFRRTVEALYEDGVRLFVEVGPHGNLTSFVEDILRRKPICAVASNLQHRSGVSQVNHLAGLLAAQGVPVDLTYLYRWRNPRGINLDAADLDTPHPATSEQPLRTGVTTLQLPPEFVRRAQTAAALQQREIPREEIAPPQQTASAPFSPDGLSHASHAPTASPAATPALVEAAPSLAAAAHAFLETMEQFLAVQESVMRRFL